MLKRFLLLEISWMGKQDLWARRGQTQGTRLGESGRKAVARSPVAWDWQQGLNSLGDRRGLEDEDEEGGKGAHGQDHLQHPTAMAAVDGLDHLLGAA